MSDLRGREGDRLSVLERATTRLVARNTEATVGCEKCEVCYGSRKLMARVTALGVHLFCRGCREEPVLSWAELDRLRGELLGPA